MAVKFFCEKCREVYDINTETVVKLEGVEVRVGDENYGEIKTRCPSCRKLSSSSIRTKQVVKN